MPSPVAVGVAIALVLIAVFFLSQGEYNYPVRNTTNDKTRR
jgi:hypothetical protein